MVDSLRFWFVYLLIVTAIIFVGWGQPIRYRFMSPKEIALEELATPSPAERRLILAAQGSLEVPATTPIPWMWDPQRKTPLDREPYNYRQSPGYNNGRYLNGLNSQ